MRWSFLTESGPEHPRQHESAPVGLVIVWVILSLVSFSSKRKTWEMILKIFLDMTARNIFIPSSLYQSSSVALPDDLKTPARYRRPQNASSSTIVIYSHDRSKFFMPTLFDILRSLQEWAWSLFRRHRLIWQYLSNYRCDRLQAILHFLCPRFNCFDSTFQIAITDFACTNLSAVWNYYSNKTGLDVSSAHHTIFHVHSSCPKWIIAINRFGRIGSTRWQLIWKVMEHAL